jgi:hypothetical protein
VQRPVALDVFEACVEAAGLAAPKRWQRRVAGRLLLFPSSRGLSQRRGGCCNQGHDLIRGLNRRLALTIYKIDHSLRSRRSFAICRNSDTHQLITTDVHWIAVGGG